MNSLESQKLFCKASMCRWLLVVAFWLCLRRQNLHLVLKKNLKKEISKDQNHWME